MYGIKKKIFLITLIFYAICVILFSYWGLSPIEQFPKSDTMKRNFYFDEDFMRLSKPSVTDFQFNSGLDPTPFPPKLPVK